MKLDEVAGLQSSQFEHDLASPAKSPQSDQLQKQLSAILDDCIQRDRTPPRIDVVTAIERLHTIGPVLTHPQSDTIITHIIQHLNQCDPTTIQRPIDLAQLIQNIIAAIAPSPSMPVKPRAMGESPHFHRHRHRPNSPHNAGGLSHLIKRFIKFIFG